MKVFTVLYLVGIGILVGSLLLRLGLAFVAVQAQRASRQGSAQERSRERRAPPSSPRETREEPTPA